MKQFECQDCKKDNFSSAELENQTDPTCVFCGSANLKEVPLNGTGTIQGK